jgi:hypothetical protein
MRVPHKFSSTQVDVALGLTVAVLILCAFTGAAHADVPAPAWKLLAATGPTNLPPKQSEVQRVSVEAEGGEFTLSQATAKVEGTLGFAWGFADTTTGSNVVTVTLSFEGTYAVGELITGGGIPEGTTIIGVSGSKAKPVLELSNDATASEEPIIEVFSKEVTGVAASSGSFHVGDAISGEHIPSGTTVTGVGASTLDLSKFVSGGGSVLLTAQETTAPVAYDATPAVLQAGLEALPAIGAGGVNVSGGPGGDSANPYFLEFGGSLSDTDVPEVSGDGSTLIDEHGYVHVATLVPGGPGTGEIAIFPSNVGGAATSGEISVELGSLPAGIVTAGEARGIEPGWSCVTTETTAKCTNGESVGALQPMTGFVVPVRVETTNAFTSQATVTITGGGVAEPGSYQLPIVVSSQPARAGVAAFFSNAFEADGEPATQAGGHPYSQVTEFQVNTVRANNGKIIPAGNPRDIDVNLPPGFLGDPLVTERCPAGLVAPVEGTEQPACNEAQQRERYSLGILVPGTDALGAIFPHTIKAPIYNDVPAGGAAAEFTTKIVQAVDSLVGSVRSDEDFGVRVSSPNTPSANPKPLYAAFTAFYGEPPAAHGKAFLRSPTDCAEQARQAPSLNIEASSWQQPTIFDTTTQQVGPVTGCDKLKFNPEFAFQPTSTQGSSGAGATAHLHIDQSGMTDPNQLATPDLKTSVVTLPEGFTINPAQANGLSACSEAQMGYIGEGALPNPTRFNEAPVSCPDAAKLGTVEITSPLLESPLSGTIYLAAQEENPFHSLIAVYLVVESKRFGITLKLPGKVETNPTTGRVTATFDSIPQQPVEDLTLKLRGGGPRSEFATPEVCGSYSTDGSWTPWSAPESGPPAQTKDAFTVAQGCSPSAAARPFAPAFEAGTTNPSAGAYSPLVIKVNRNDGEQELTKLNFTLPEGLIGNLASVPYCSDAAIEAARAKLGRAEQASPSCPATSQIGTVDAAAGVGAEPLHVGGNVYMAGPYEGAPLSAVVITPAVAGPFDLGDVVVRAPLFVNSTTAQITARSDALPTILEGIPLKLRSVAITLDRSNFTLNPTSCAAMAVTASIGSSDGATATPSNRFQVGGCGSLPFKPSLSATTQGKASKANGASLVVKIAAKPGEANIGKVNLQLPVQLPSRLTTLQKACTEAQFNTNPAGCPAESVVGSATAHTPILQAPLSGPAYLVSHGGAAFPDVEFVLQAHERGGDIEIVLDGGTQIKKGITYSNFETVPDAPISSFETVLPTGPHSILTANLPASAKYNLCGRALKMPTTLTGQNGAVLKRSTLVAVTGCAPSIRVMKHTVEGKVATFVVSVPSAGKLTAKGAGLTSAAKTVSAAKNVTLKLKLNKKEQAFLARHQHRKLRLRVKLQFTPKKGSKMATAATVLVG